MEEAIAQELREGQQVKLHGDPASEQPVAGYGGRAPKHRKKQSRLVTWAIIIVTLLVFLGYMTNHFVPWTGP